MSQTEYEVAVAQFLAKKTITRCPTACVTATHAAPAETDVAALRNYSAAKEAARKRCCISSSIWPADARTGIRWPSARRVSVRARGGKSAVSARWA